jgi:hypothetical protein
MLEFILGCCVGYFALELLGSLFYVPNVNPQPYDGRCRGCGIPLTDESVTELYYHEKCHPYGRHLK